MLQFSSTVSQLDAQKNLLGVGAFVGATDMVGDGVGFVAVVGATVTVCGAVGASIFPSVHCSGATVKHASVTLLHVAQSFAVLSKHILAACEKAAAQILNAGASAGGGVVGAAVGSLVGADVSGGQRFSFN